MTGVAPAKSGDGGSHGAPRRGDYAAARAAAIQTAVGQLEALAAGETDEPEAMALIRQNGEMVVVSYNGGASSFMRLSTPAQPLTVQQIAVAIRLQEAFFVGHSGSSNAAQIEKWLQQGNPKPVTKEQTDQKAFGTYIHCHDDTAPNRDPHAAMFEAAAFLGWVKREVSRVSWPLLEMSVRLELSPVEMAARLEVNREYLSQRLREALAEAVAAAKGFDAHQAASGKVVRSPAMLSP